MDETLLPPSAFLEAADMDTPARRLAELARFPVLLPLIAANPATPTDVLAQLSEADEVAVRRAVALNPNTSLQILGQLAGEFPGEFLHNPILPILNMTRPDFIKELPYLTWAGLLKYEQLSPFWFQQLKTDIRYQRVQPAIWKLVQLHVSQTGETRKTLDLIALDRPPRSWKTTIQEELKRDLGFGSRSIPLTPSEELEIFLLVVLLFPSTVPMLKEQWVQIARTSWRRAGNMLAVSKTVGGKTLMLLSHEKSLFVRCQVARHLRVSVKILGRLATAQQPEVRRAVASNPRTPQEIISLLLVDPQSSVRRAAVSHPTLTSEDHEILALDRESSVRAALASLHLLDNTLMAQLASDSCAQVRAAVARNLHAPQEILATLASDVEPGVRAAAAANPCLPEGLQATLRTDPAEMVRANLSSNACLSEQNAALLAQDPSLTVRASLAANPRVPLSLLEQLWQMREREVWRSLARNPRLTPELLTQLAQQGNEDLQAIVAAHKRTPQEVLRELARENRSEIWYALAANPQTPLDVLEQALALSDTELWLRLFKHPTIARAQHHPFLTLLTSKLQPLIAANSLPDWLRRVVFQYYNALPAALLELFASSPHWEERYLAVRHPRMSDARINELARDGICYVRTAAQDVLANRQQRSRVSSD